MRWCALIIAILEPSISRGRRKARRRDATAGAATRVLDSPEPHDVPSLTEGTVYVCTRAVIL